MNNYNAPTVRFHCCGMDKEFLHPREFSMCECGSSGFDSGDGFYQRILGHRDDVDVIGYNITKDKKYCEEQDLKYYPLSQSILKAGTSFSIKIEGPGKYKLTQVVCPDDNSAQTLHHGTYSSLRDANRRMKKLLKVEK